jgi:hypothetical protein
LAIAGFSLLGVAVIAVFGAVGARRARPSKPGHRRRHHPGRCYRWLLFRCADR